MSPGVVWEPFPDAPNLIMDGLADLKENIFNFRIIQDTKVTEFY